MLHEITPRLIVGLLSTLILMLTPRLPADPVPPADASTPPLPALKVAIPANLPGLQKDPSQHPAEFYVYKLSGRIFPEETKACAIHDKSLRAYTEAICRYLTLGQSGDATRLEEACDTTSAQTMRRHLETPALRARLLAHWASKRAFQPIVVIQWKEQRIVFGETLTADGSRRPDFYCLAATPAGFRITTQGELAGPLFQNLAIAMADPNARAFLTPEG
jgi:hypothetical protein